jgi:uncharacterized damage-inducible protein DinB
MDSTKNLAKHFREFYFGGNWTASSVQKTLDGINWEQATTKVETLHTIATLTYHIHYYVKGALQVFKGGTLDIKDKFSFAHPPIESESDWQRMQTLMWQEGEDFAQAVERMDDDILNEHFTDEKYGSYFRNVLGIIEHGHYHLGQIAMLKKILSSVD